MTQITSPQNPRLKARQAPRHPARARRAAGASPPRARTSCSPPSAAGRPPLEGYRAGRLGDRRRRASTTSSRRRCGPRPTLGSGTRVIGVYEQRWGARDRAAVRVPARRRRPGQRRHGRCAPRRPSAPRASRSGRAARTRTRRRPCARAWARSSPSPLARVGDVGELPGERVALVADAPRRAARGSTRGRRAPARSRCWSAPSATACRRRSSRRASAARASRSPRSRSTRRWRRPWRCTR